MTAFDTGPYISAALFCERVLQESDGVASYIRVVDRFVRRVVAVPGTPLPPQRIEGFVVVVLKPGQARGAFSLGMRLEKPSGEQGPAQMVTVHFSGGPANGVNVHIQTALDLDQEGVYWLDILGGDNQLLMSRVPLELQVQRVSEMPQGPAS